MDKFGGVGIHNMIVITLFVIVFTVIAKVILTKYPVSGLTEFVLSA